ncbi:unnamed protein product [Rotaria sp. Silwood1]|nr:unnamed protein product [Rotaria sp. Silwood1]CAF3447948.1 unnamed protein product [Rotaria sp. Silwood1]CAF4850689.1 unnamed protein product [Rotaria sp. Silwood1]
MNRILLYSNILILLSILIIFPLVNSSTSCSIFPLLNCSCFQSNIDLNPTSIIKTYSHLYCQGNSLTEKTFQSPFGYDFKYQNHFRTVSIEFFIENHIEIQSNQFDSLSMLFSETDNNDQIDIFLRFNGFKHITFHNHSLTSRIFQKRPQNKRLWIHLIPMRSNLTQIEFDEENSTNIEDPFKFFSNCFSGLTVSQLIIYIHTIQDRFSSLNSFEQIFNNTNIGELHFHGSIIRPSTSLLKEKFKGLIRSLTLHRHVDTIDANTFPYYSHVYSYTIHSIEAHSMNLNSFLTSYKNLRGLEIIKPRFEVSIDQFIPTLDSLTIDVEDINEKTLFAARHIYNLKFGTRLHTIDPQIFVFLSQRLHHLDLSDVNLSQMKSDSRCYLIEYISKNYQQSLNIILPRVKNLTQCDCTRLFINHIQLNKNLKKHYNFSSCSKLCYFNDCPTISEYFKKFYPLYTDENQLNHINKGIINNKNNSNKYLSSVDIFSDSIDIHMMSFLMNQTNDQEQNSTLKLSTTTITTTTTTLTVTTLIDTVKDNISSLENIQEYDDIISFSTPKFVEPWNDQTDEEKIEILHPNQNQSFSWFLRYKKKSYFQPLPVHV